LILRRCVIITSFDITYYCLITKRFFSSIIFTRKRKLIRTSFPYETFTFFYVIDFCNLFSQNDSRKKNESLILSGAPTRANEKGTCPTCNRHFGIRAYDRHVAWCKDRITQVSVNPAVNLAKERLEARIRYRAPTLKSRRTVTREKYSPGSATNQSTKSSLSAPSLAKPKENTLITNYSRETPIKQKPAIV
jgi:hypothetical protein